MSWNYGHNVAGYLPDGDDDPPVDDWADALFGYVDMMQRYADAHDEALKDADAEDLMRPCVDAIVAELKIQTTIVTDATQGLTFWVYDVNRRPIVFWLQRVELEVVEHA